MTIKLTDTEAEELRDLMIRFRYKEPGLYRRTVGKRIAIVRVEAVPVLLKETVEKFLKEYEFAEEHDGVRIYIHKEEFPDATCDA